MSQASDTAQVGGELVPRILDETASRYPTAPALRDGQGAWTYEELARASWSASAWLAGLGVRARDRVLVRAIPDRVVVALLYGCLRIGAVFVPVSMTMKPYQFRHVLADADPSLVVTGPADAADVADGPHSVRSLHNLWEAIRGVASVPQADPRQTVPGTVSPEDLAMLLYTSGSTAQPKAVACPQTAVAFATRAIAERLQYRTDDVVFCRLPLSFDYGLYQVFLCTLARCELVLAGSVPGPRLLAEVRASGATVMPIVPSLASMLLSLAHRDPKSTKIRLFTNTGEHLTTATAMRLRQHFAGAAVQMMYGTTECKRVSVLEANGDLNRPGSVGHPLTGTVVRIVDIQGRKVPTGDVGEITVRGPHLMAGYWNAPELTARTFRTDPSTGERTLHTGDFGRVDEDGHLYFAGRSDSRFKQYGTRVSSTEIEAAAESLPGVRSAVVLPPSSTRDAVLCLTGEITPTEALRGMHELLDPPRIPRICHVFDAFPLTENGKVSRTRLAQLVEAQRP